MDDILCPDDIDEIFRFWRIKGAIVAAVRQAEDGSWTKTIHCYGERNEKGEPVTDETRFFIASNSKLFCVLAADRALREAGYAQGLRTRIQAVVPAYDLVDKVAAQNATFEDVLAHCSGLPRHDHYMTTDVRTLEDMLEAVKHMKPSLPFRTGHQYHNPHYNLVALIVARLAGCSYHDYITATILRPLGMHNTSVHVGPTLAGNHAEGYWEWGATAACPQGGRAVPVPCGLSDHCAASLGSGHMSSTAADMAVWLQALLAGMPAAASPTTPPYLHTATAGSTSSPASSTAVLSPALLQRCRSGTVRFHEYARAYPELGPAVYGLALSEQAYLGCNLVEHVGSLPGWMSRLMLVPDHPACRLGVYIAVNNAPWGEMAGEEVKHGILERALGVRHVDWRARFLAEKRTALAQQEATLAAAGRQPTAGAGAAGLLAPSALAGVYTAPGFVTWTLEERHILAQPPAAALAAILPLPMVWGSVQPLLWPAGGSDKRPCYTMGWRFTFPPAMARDDVVGQPVAVEMDMATGEDGTAVVRGFGVRGLWGAGKGVPSPEGQTVEERAEVYFAKIR